MPVGRPAGRHRRVQPLLEGRAGELGVRSEQGGPVRVALAVGVGGVAPLLDPQAVAATRRTRGVRVGRRAPTGDTREGDRCGAVTVNRRLRFGGGRVATVVMTTRDGKPIEGKPAPAAGIPLTPAGRRRRASRPGPDHRDALGRARLLRNLTGPLLRV